MADHQKDHSCKKGGKFVTGIVIGGALGSIASWVFSSKERREKFVETAQQYYEQRADQTNRRSWWKRWFGVFFIILPMTGMMLRSQTTWFALSASDLQPVVKKIQLTFNKDNPSGNFDFKELLDKKIPTQCRAGEVICEKVIDIALTVTWNPYRISELTDQQYAEVSTPLEDPLDQKLDPSEIAYVQEILARRGLLHSLKDGQPAGETIRDRGYLGPLTWVGLATLAHLKKLDPKSPDFSKRLTQEINRIRANMASDPKYVEKTPLPPAPIIPPAKSLSSALYQQNLALAKQALKTGKAAQPKAFSNIPKSFDLEGKLEVIPVSGQ